MAVRTSKFRHIFGDRNVKSYNGVPISKNAHEQDFCSVNPKFVAVVAEQIGGGAFFVMKTDKIGGIDPASCKISKHNGAVYDIRLIFKAIFNVSFNYLTFLISQIIFHKSTIFLVDQ